MPERKQSRPAPHEPKQVKRDASSGSISAKGLLAVQSSAGNAAATSIVQRWKKGVLPGEQPPDPGAQQWVKGVIPAAAPPAKWVKAQPKGGTPKAGDPFAAQRDPRFQAVLQIKQQLELGQKAAEAADKAGAQGEEFAKAAVEAKTQVATLDKNAGQRLTIAKTFWASEEPFAGGNAATQSAAVDLLWTKADAAATAAKDAHKATKALPPIAGGAIGTANKAVRGVQAAGKGFGVGPSDARNPHAASLGAAAELRTIRYNIKKQQVAIREAMKRAKEASGEAATGLKSLTKTQTEIWKPLKVGGGPEVIIGRLQQQLNATRGPGVERISVTAHFTPKTEQLLKAFAGGAAVADVSAWAKLDKAAPAVQQSGEWVILSPEGAKVQGTPFKGMAGLEGMTRPWILPKVTPNEAWYAVDRGPAVVELQQRLTNWVKAKGLWARISMPWIRPTGTYDRRTGEVLKAFQKASGLAEDGKVSGPVWNKLDAVQGPVDQGMVMLNELTEVEGQDRGQTIKYSWKVVNDELRVIVKIAFVPLDPLTQSLSEPTLKKDKADPTKVDASEVPMLQARMQTAIGNWQTDITRVWNGFSAKDSTPGSKKNAAKLVFVPEMVKSGGDATVNVIPGPTVDNDEGRSDAANWFASDTSADLAPHEFGHLIGLPDEYSRREGHFVETTGTEAPIGNVLSPLPGWTAADHARYIAQAIGAATPVVGAADPADPVRKTVAEEARGKSTAFKTAVSALGLGRDGAFGRAVSEEFANDATAKVVSGGKSIPEYVVGLVAPLNSDDDVERGVIFEVQAIYEDPMRSFLVSNNTVMGYASQSVPVRGKQVPLGHNHPVQARHFQPFLKHLDSAFGGSWKVV